MDYFITLVLINLLVTYSSGFPDGAPTAACSSMMPGHFELEPQSSDPPYALYFQEIAAQESFIVTLEVNDAVTLKGYMIQVRRDGSPDPLGYFSNLPEDSKTIDCSAFADTLTHSNNDASRTTVTASWYAQGGDLTNARFVATVVQRTDIFWTGLSTGTLESHVAFTARLVQPMSDLVNKTTIVFEEVSSNEGRWYDTNTGQFQGPINDAGIYYMSMSMGIPEGGVCTSGLYWSTDLTNPFVGIKFENTFSNGSEYSSRGFLQQFPSFPDPVQMLADPGCSLLGSPEQTTSWTMFRYSNMSSFTVAFSVALTDTLIDVAPSFPWDVVFVNEGGSGSPVGPMDPDTGFFTAAEAGYYFFHLSAGSVPQQISMPIMVHWPATGGQETFAALSRTASSILGMDTASRSTIIHLDVNDQVSIGNNFGSHLASSPDNFETSFSGFAYAMTNVTRDEAIAFCVHMGYWSWNAPEDTVLDNWSGFTANFAGPNGTAFNLVTGVFTAPVSGTYFFSFSIGIENANYGMAWLSGPSGTELARIDRQNTLLNGRDTQSRDVIVNLNAGNTVRLHAKGGSGLFSEAVRRETSFLGLHLRFFKVEAT